MLNKNAGTSGLAMTVDLGARVAKGFNALGSKVWDHFKNDDPDALVDIDIVSSIVVSFTKPYALILTICARINFVFSSCFQSSLSFL